MRLILFAEIATLIVIVSIGLRIGRLYLTLENSTRTELISAFGMATKPHTTSIRRIKPEKQNMNGRLVLGSSGSGAIVDMWVAAIDYERLLIGHRQHRQAGATRRPGLA